MEQSRSGCQRRGRQSHPIATQSHAPYQLAVELALATIEVQTSKQAADKIRLKLFNDLLTYLEAVPNDAFLATTLAELTDQLPATVKVGDKQANVNELTKIAVAKAFEKNPRNYFLLNQLLNVFLNSNDPKVKQFIPTAKELSRPFGQSDSKNEIIETIELATEQLDSNLDEAMSYLGQASNLMKQTTGFRSDERATRPHILALIDLSETQKLIQKKSMRYLQLSQPNECTETPTPTFKEHRIDIVADSICWYDWNIDLTPELAWTNQDKLVIGTVGESEPYAITPISEIKIAPGVHTILPVDLFEVEFAQRPQRDFQRRQEDLKANAGTDQVEKVLSMRHETFRDLVLAGENGIQIATFEDKPNGDSPFTCKIVTSATGLEPYKNITQIQPIDWDADGDLDLVIVADRRLALLQIAAIARSIR